MSLKANNKPASAGGQAELLEPSNYPARIAQVIDLGMQAQRAFEGKVKKPANEIMVTYELGTEFMQDEEGNDLEDKPRWISERFPLYSLASERAKSTVRYKALDPSLTCDGDWSLLVGKPCLVGIVNNVSKANGKTYNNVGSISQPIKGMVTPELVNEPKVFSLDEPDLAVFYDLPEWIQDIIRGGLDFKGSALDKKLQGGTVKATEEPVVELDEDVPY